MSNVADDDSEDDLDWEEVDVPDHHERHLEITLQAAPKKEGPKHKGTSHADRVARIDCHKIHTVALLLNASVRNRWINDPLLHARLLSLTPLTLQNAFGMIHKSRIPDQNQRGRMFEAAITNLVEWWASTFFEVTYEGHIRNTTYDYVQTKLAALTLLSQDSPEGVLDMEAVQDMFGGDPEVIRSPKSLMKHALMRSGSRDTSAQLFTALCRGLGIPARLVVSLQSVPWQTHVGKPKPVYDRKRKGKKAKGTMDESQSHANESMEEVDIPNGASTPDFKGKGKATAFTGEGQRLDGLPIPTKSDKAKGKEKAKPPIKLRKTKRKGQVLGSSAGPSSSTTSSRPSSPALIDPTTTPPVFWTEVFSRPDGRWLPVDPIRSIVNKRKVFDPTPVTLPPATQPSGASLFPFPGPGRRSTPSATAKAANQENRMLYVLAFEEDGYARDVTRRYAREFSAKVAKVQGGSGTAAGGGGKARVAWWQRVVGAVSRPYRLHRDDIEDEELDTAQLMEGMPTTITGFKDHPLYVLARHLKQTEVIHPSPPATPELGKFRGEPVYPRSSVVSLKTAENWMRSEGRAVREGSQPLKVVKVRAGTVNKMRELEVLREAGAGEGEGSEGGVGGEATQGLYARSQTEMYRPDPVINGKIPKNNFGNIDLYVSSMLPEGAVHIPFKGVAKLARKLGIDFAEAVTGFEFKKRRAFPIIEGVVVAQENEALLLEAYWEAEKEAARKAEVKRNERVIKHWTRLIHGLRIRQRLKEQYSTGPGDGNGVGDMERSGGAHGDGDKREAAILGMSAINASGSGAVGGGGFMTAADDVVQPFHLPRSQFQRVVDEDGSPTAHAGGSEHWEEVELAAEVGEVVGDSPGGVVYALHTMDVDSEEEMVQVEAVRDNDSRGPKTMRELAEDAEERRRMGADVGAGEVEVLEIGPSSSAAALNNGKGDGDDGVRPHRVNRKGRGRGRNGSASTMPTRRPKAENKGERGSSARRSWSRGASVRGIERKRRRNKHEDNEEEEDSMAFDSEDDASGHGGDEDRCPSPPRKKPRGAPSASGPAPATEGRTLRPRKSKTAAQLHEEEEQEEVYRRAVAR